MIDGFVTKLHLLCEGFINWDNGRSFQLVCGRVTTWGKIKWIEKRLWVSAPQNRKTAREGRPVLRVTRSRS